MGGGLFLRVGYYEPIGSKPSCRFGMNMASMQSKAMISKISGKQQIKNMSSQVIIIAAARNCRIYDVSGTLPLLAFPPQLPMALIINPAFSLSIAHYPGGP